MSALPVDHIGQIPIESSEHQEEEMWKRRARPPVQKVIRHDTSLSLCDNVIDVFEGACVLVVEFFYTEDEEENDSGRSSAHGTVFHDPKAFKDFLAKPFQTSIICRLIHVLNAPWTIDILESIPMCTGPDFDEFFCWAREKRSGTMLPGERVWRPDIGVDHVQLKMALDYLASHQKDTSRPECCRKRVATLDPRDAGDLTAASGNEEWHVCLHRVSVILHAGPPPHASPRPASPLATAILFENSAISTSCLRIPPDFNWRREKGLDVVSSACRFLEHVLYITMSQVNLSWYPLIEKSELHVTHLEANIYGDPENDHWADDLWACSRYWLIYNRALAKQNRTLGYLHPKITERFFAAVRIMWNLAKQDTAAISPGIMAAYEKRQHQLTQNLVNPTANMLDMVYKRVAIRDARHSLQLNESLWRLSWVTIIFMPLTFVAGVFGMNVDLFADNPSFKWYFAVAIPLMVLVFMGWYLFRNHQAWVRRSKRPEHMI